LSVERRRRCGIDVPLLSSGAFRFSALAQQKEPAVLQDSGLFFDFEGALEDQLAQTENDGQADQEDDEHDPENDFHS